jgi:hypothetical protein
MSRGVFMLGRTKHREIACTDDNDYLPGWQRSSILYRDE